MAPSDPTDIPKGVPGERADALYGLPLGDFTSSRDALVRELAKDTAIQAADTLLLTVPNQLGVEYNAHAIESILKYVASELGWR